MLVAKEHRGIVVGDFTSILFFGQFVSLFVLRFPFNGESGGMAFLHVGVVSIFIGIVTLLFRFQVLEL
jgi:hypothetical protein